MTHEQLREIALGVFNGSIFTSWEIEPSESELMIPMIFMPLIFLSEEQRADLIKLEPVVFWGHVNTTARCINGYPIMMEANPLNKEQWAEVRAMVAKLVDAAKEL